MNRDLRDKNLDTKFFLIKKITCFRLRRKCQSKVALFFVSRFGFCLCDGPNPRQIRDKLGQPRGFFFFIFKKIKISKIYVRFGKFQKYTPIALWGATGLKCNFFFQICNEVPGVKKKGGPVAPPPRATGGPTHRRDRGPVTPPRATGPSPPI